MTTVTSNTSKTTITTEGDDAENFENNEPSVATPVSIVLSDFDSPRGSSEILVSQANDLSNLKKLTSQRLLNILKAKKKEDSETSINRPESEEETDSNNSNDSDSDASSGSIYSDHSADKPSLKGLLAKKIMSAADIQKAMAQSKVAAIDSNTSLFSEGTITSSMIVQLQPQLGISGIQLDGKDSCEFNSTGNNDSSNSISIYSSGTNSIRVSATNIGFPLTPKQINSGLLELIDVPIIPIEKNQYASDEESIESRDSVEFSGINGSTDRSVLVRHGSVSNTSLKTNQTPLRKRSSLKETSSSSKGKFAAKIDDLKREFMEGPPIPNVNNSSYVNSASSLTGSKRELKSILKRNSTTENSNASLQIVLSDDSPTSSEFTDNDHTQSADGSRRSSFDSGYVLSGLERKPSKVKWYKYTISGIKKFAKD